MNSGWEQVIAYARWFGLSFRALRLYLTLSYYGWTLAGVQPQPITSGRRTAERQRQLLTRWEAGDPGIAVKPAARSRHLTGDAFDLGSSSAEVLAFYGAILYRLGILGARWGGNFRTPDRIHFDVGDL